MLAMSNIVAQTFEICLNPGGDCPAPIRHDANPNLNACSTATNFNATPFLDACTNGVPPCQHYGDYPENNTISLYGDYGNLENNSQFATTSQAHYNLGTTIAHNNFVPRCENGSTPSPTCAEGGLARSCLCLLVSPTAISRSAAVTPTPGTIRTSEVRRP